MPVLDDVPDVYLPCESNWPTHNKRGIHKRHRCAQIVSGRLPIRRGISTVVVVKNMVSGQDSPAGTDVPLVGIIVQSYAPERAGSLRTVRRVLCW